MHLKFDITFKFVLVVGLFLSSTGCSSLLYHPTDYLYSKPDQSLRLKEYFISVGTEDKIQAWSLESSNKKTSTYHSTVIFFHGNAENLTSHFQALDWLPRGGFRVFIFSYRGYGLSTGEPSPKKTVEDGIAAISFAAELFPRDRLYLFGQSLGGAVALRSLIDSPAELKAHIKGVLVEGTFKSYEDVGAATLSHSWITWPFQWLSYLLLSDRYAPSSKIDLYPENIPTLIFHSKNDHNVKFKLGEDLYRALPPPNKAFVFSESAGHIAMLRSEDGKYRKVLLSFFSQPEQTIRKLRQPN